MACGVYSDWRDTAPKEGDQLCNSQYSSVIQLDHSVDLPTPTPDLVLIGTTLLSLTQPCHLPHYCVHATISPSLSPNPQLWVLSLDAAPERPSGHGTGQRQVVLGVGQPHAHPRGELNMQRAGYLVRLDGEECIRRLPLRAVAQPGDASSLSSFASSPSC
ncbi:hypothetical protein GE21DRAFT_1072332 [Neurospora crassa]|nr:hypothetical protein GE21DRAFT_1072332 [Neurospora crassa]